MEPRRGLPGAPLGAGSVPKRGGEEASNGAWGGGEGRGMSKNPRNYERTTPACRCEESGESGWWSEQRVPAEAERAAAARGRMSAGVVLTSPAAESY